jgi:tyrosine-protein kinase Etk/Wzc
MEKSKTNGRPRVPHEPDGLTLTQIKTNALKKWYWFVIFSVVFVGLAYLYNKVTQPKYKISTTVLIKNDSKILELFNIFQNQKPGKASGIIADQMGVIKSYSLNYKAMQSLDWQYSWYRKLLLAKSDLYGNDPFDLVIPAEAIQTDRTPVLITVNSPETFTVKVESKKTVKGKEIKIDFESVGHFGDPFKNAYFNFTLNKKTGFEPENGDQFILVFNNPAKLAQEYKDRIEVEQTDENSNLVTIQLETEQLRRDVEFLNKLAAFYIQNGLDEKNRMANNTVRFIDNLIAGVNDSLQMAGDSFTSFRSRNKTVNLGAEATRIVDKLRELDSEQSKLNLKLEYYNNLRYYLDNKEEIQELVAPSLIGIRDEDMNSMVMKLNDLYTKREVLSYTVQDKNPTLLSINNEIQFTQKLISEKVANQIQNTNMELRSLRATQQRVNSELVRLPKTEQDLIGIKRNYDLNNELYTFLLQRRAEAEIARASNNPDAQILDPASTEIAELLGPKKVKNLITGLLSGLVLAMLAVILNEYFTDKIRTVDDINRIVDFPVTASITESKFKSEIPVIHYPKSAVTESFRGLRINLQSHFKDQNVLAVHSYISGEGKSFVALNMALVLAISNKRVLLVDADLRKPRLHTILRTKNGPGLSDFLAGKAQASEIIIPTPHAGLSFVPSGNIPHNPAELLGNGKLPVFTEQMKDQFDYVVFDNAPFGVVSDGTMVGLNADINLFLVRLNYSLKENLEELNRVHNEGIIRNALVAVNGLKQRAGYGYYNEDAKRVVPAQA